MLRARPLMPKMPAAVLAALLLICPFAVQSQESEGGKDLILIFDASGSMWGQIEGENKIVIARRVLGGLIDGLDDDTRVGLVAYGHRREGDCEDIETIAPLGPLDKAGLKTTVEGLNPKGKTPITASVEAALALVESTDGAGGTSVVLVSDGLETCGGDPCAAVRLAKERGLPFVMHVVGFDVAGEDTTQLECAAQAGNGRFVSADNAAELGAALEEVVTAPTEIPPGRLVVTGVADGELQDVGVVVTDVEAGEMVANGRTYVSPETNPRELPLEDGVYDVVVQAVGIRGAPRQTFQIEIVDGSRVEKTADFSSGEISVEVLRNGELGDAVVRVYERGTTTMVTGGRTYTSASSNPKVLRVVAGEYDLWVGSTEIAGQPERLFEGLVVEGKGRVERQHEFSSGTLSVEVRRGSELVDAVLQLRDLASTPVDQSRTYTSPTSNPSVFTVVPGTYRIQVREIRGEERSIEATVEAGGESRLVVDLDDGG